PIMAFTLGSVIQHTTGRTLSKCAVLLPIFLSSCAAWLLPIVSLWGMLWIQGVAASGRLAAEAFAVGTLLGGITGVPLGTGITGSMAAIHLNNHGVPLEIAALSIAILRAGTAWYALGVGLFALLRWKNQIIALWHPCNRDDHFEDIAPAYA